MTTVRTKFYVIPTITKPSLTNKIKQINKHFTFTFDLL